MEHTNVKKLAALAFLMAEVTERVVEHSMVDASTSKVVMDGDVEATLEELIARTRVLAREVLGHNETVH